MSEQDKYLSTIASGFRNTTTITTTAIMVERNKESKDEWSNYNF